MHGPGAALLPLIATHALWPEGKWRSHEKLITCVQIPVTKAISSSLSGLETLVDWAHLSTDLRAPAICHKLQIIQALWPVASAH
jgi:hypothetical protein